MAKFILLYRGPATPPGEMAQEQTDEVMQAWGAWMGRVGDSITDIGNPFGTKGAVRADGVAADASDLNGYTIVEAADLGAAMAICEGHPFLSDGSDRFAVEVYELVDVPMPT